jgi:addiction module HigA family antidote
MRTSYILNGTSSYPSVSVLNGTTTMHLKSKSLIIIGGKPYEVKLSQNRLAIALCVPARRINEIVLGKRAITADTALRLARYFKMSPQFWLGLQMDYELDVALDVNEERIQKEIKPMVAFG